MRSHIATTQIHQTPESVQPQVPMPALWYTGAFWQAYGVHMRPYLLFVSAITGIAGLALVGDVSAAMALFLGAAFFLSYGFGQALTDCFQTDTDAISASYRPLIQGTIRRADVIRVSLVGLTGCGLALASPNLLVLPLATLCVIGLATYTWFKRRWWAGPFYNAWIVAGVYLMGVLAGSPGAGITIFWNPVVSASLLVVFFGYANFVLSGYFKDIGADRATGYDTLPVRFGVRISSVVSDVFAFLAVVGCARVLYLVLSVDGVASPAGASLIFAGAGLGATILAQVRLHEVKDERQAHLAINPVVHAYILLLSAVSIVQQPSWAISLAVFYGAFVITMRRRPAAHQI